MSLTTDIRRMSQGQSFSLGFSRPLLSERAIREISGSLPQFLVPLVALGTSWAIYATLDGAPRAARMVPDVICVVVAVLALVQVLVTSIALFRRMRNATHVEADSVEEPTSFADFALQGVVLALMIAFVPAVQAFGFLVPSLAFIALVGVLSGDKALYSIILSAAAVSIVFGGMSAAGFYYPLW